MQRKTHSGRRQGAIYAELAGIKEHQIRKAGHWNQDAMTNCYQSELPREFIRGLAGFPHEALGNFHLPRAKVLPPDSLRRALWPWIDHWVSWFQSNDSADLTSSLPPVSSLQDAYEGPPDHNDIAAQGFLRMLDHLRTVLLQDSVVYQREFPDHPMWEDPIFERDDYKQFARLVFQSLQTSEAAEDVRLRQELPDIIANNLIVTRNFLCQQTKESQAVIERSLGAISGQVDNVRNFCISAFHAVGTALVSVAPAPTSSFSGSSAQRTAQSGSRVPEMMAPLTALASHPQQPAPSATISRPQTLAISEIDAPHSSSHPVHPSPDLPPPRYELSRAVGTVPELWQEWKYGLGGWPSVEYLEEKYHADWRPSCKERLFFSRRKRIIDAIYGRAKNGRSLEAAVAEVEGLRTGSAPKPLSLNQLGDLFRTKK